jgi:hypothetical protein
MEQISLLEFVDKKDKEKLTPEMWSCMKTCANFTDDLGNGLKDTFFDGSPRCCIEFHTGEGLSGKHMKSKVIDNIWHTWCIHYKPKGG